MQPDSCIEFPPFRLDLVNQELWRGSERLPLRGKPFAVLAYLATHPKRLVQREELVQAVWRDTHVGEGLLRGYVRDLRAVLGDDPAAPRFIETVARRGYRFVAPLCRRMEPDGVAAEVGSEGEAALAPVVGRKEQLEELERQLADAAGGRRRVVFVTGEVGIGKTTLVDAFARSAARRRVRMARGQCLEHFGVGEPYLPLLEALGGLCRAAERDDAVGVLARHAPTWLAEMPALIPDAELDTVRRRVQGATRERMLREFAEAVEVLAAAEPLVLVLEDLHWSDHSTLDVLSSLARRRERARLLLLGTYRPAEVAGGAHPLAAIKRDLHAHGLCSELALPTFDADEVSEYLAVRFPREPHAPHLGVAIHRATEGNPMFVVGLVDAWAANAASITPGGGANAARPSAADGGVPDTLRQLVGQQIERLAPDARRVLEAASAVGGEFSTAAVAAALAEPEESVEAECEQLAGRGLFLRALGVDASTSGGVSGRYQFLHALQRQVFYERPSPTRRVRLHRRIGAWLEQACGALAHERAAELAVHFEKGHDPVRAVHHLDAAARNAIRKHAYHEAAALLGKALDLLADLPATAEARLQEVSLRMALGTTLLTTRGYAAAEVEQAYARAHELCRNAEGPHLPFALAGLFRFYFTRGDLARARDLGEQVLRIAEARDRALLPVAHSLVGLPLLSVADFAAARAHLERGVALYDFDQHRTLASEHGDDPGLTALAFLAIALWFVGLPDAALARTAEADALAERLATPYCVAFAHSFASWIHVRRGEPAAVQARCDALLRLAAEQGFRFFVAEGAIFRGWSLVQQGRIDPGLEQLRDGLATQRAIGALVGRPSHLALLAEACLRADRPEAGLDAVEEALTTLERTGERSYEAELRRLQGELRLAIARRSGRSRGDASEASECIRHAIDVARRQGARALELRAVVSLVHAEGARRRDTPARRHLRDLCTSFSEGFETADLRAARSLVAASPGG